MRGKSNRQYKGDRRMRDKKKEERRAEKREKKRARKGNSEETQDSEEAQAPGNPPSATAE